MCAPRTVYPWDMVITRTGNHIFFDKRDNGVYGTTAYKYSCLKSLECNFYFIYTISDLITVNENSADPPLETGDKDNINSPSALALEATLINHYFANQVVNEV